MKAWSVFASALLSSTACAQVYVFEDNFVGDAIDTAFWRSVWEGNGINTWQSGGALRIYGASQVVNWEAGGGVGSGYYPTNWLTTSVDMWANGGDGGGWWAGMTITDGSNSITYFESDSPLPRVGYTYYSAGVGHLNNFLSNQVGTKLTMLCSAGKVSMYMDGKLLGSQPLALAGKVSVQLSGAAASPWDVVDAVFTNFRLSFERA